MKQPGILFSFLLMLIMVSCKPSPQKAEQYYDAVKAPIDEVFEKEEALIVLINNETEKLASSPFTFQTDSTAAPVAADTGRQQIEQAYNDLLSQVSISKNKLSSLTGFEKSSQLKDAALALLTEYEVLCKNEYRELLQIVKIPAEDYSSEQDDRFMQLSDTIDNKLKEKIAILTDEIKMFSKKYNFKIQEDTIAVAP